MPDDSMRTVVLALGAGIGVTLAKVGAAVSLVRPLWPPRRRIHLPITPRTCPCSWLSVAAAAQPTISIPWGTGGKPISGR